MTRCRGRHTRAFVWEGWQKPARAGEELFCRHVALLQPEVRRFRSLPQAPNLRSFFQAPRYTARYCKGSETAGMNRSCAPGSVRITLTQPGSGSWRFIPVYQNRASEIPRRGAVPGKQQPRVCWNLLKAQPCFRIKQNPVMLLEHPDQDGGRPLRAGRDGGMHTELCHGQAAPEAPAGSLLSACTTPVASCQLCWPEHGRCTKPLLAAQH